MGLFFAQNDHKVEIGLIYTVSIDCTCLNRTGAKLPFA